MSTITNAFDINKTIWNQGKFIDSDNEVFYDAVQSQNLDANGVFLSEYNYGPKEEQIVKQNIIINFFQNLLFKLLKRLIYPGAFSEKVDMSRVTSSIESLLAIGGESAKMKTPDGCILDGMYLKASNFKESLEKYFQVFETTNKDGLITKKFILKKEFYREKKCTDKKGNIYYYLITNQEVKDFLDVLKALGFPADTNTKLPDTLLEKNVNPCKIFKIFSAVKSLFVKFDPFKDNVRGHSLELTGFSEIDLLPVINNHENSHPTALIATGSACSYSFYKAFAVGYLMKGLDVMMVDFRGYAKSTGSPTPYKTKLDLETAYQYLSKEKGVNNKDLLVHGHCLGGASASDLAARRKGVNLLLDRSFAQFENIAGNRLPLPQKITALINPILRKVLPLFVDYDNSKNLSKIEGNISIVMDRNDAFRKNEKGAEEDRPDAAIPESEVIKQINSLPANGNQILRLIDSNIGHSGSWMNNWHVPTTILQFNKFLSDSQLMRKVF